MNLRDGRRHGFFIVDNRIISQYGARLRPPGIALYCALCRHASRDNTAKVKHSTLAQEVGLCDRQVRRELRKLVRLGLLAVESGAKAGRPSLYTLKTVRDLPPDYFLPLYDGGRGGLPEEEGVGHTVLPGSDCMSDPGRTLGPGGSDCMSDRGRTYSPTPNEQDPDEQDPLNKRGARGVLPTPPNQPDLGPARPWPADPRDQANLLAELWQSLEARQFPTPPDKIGQLLAELLRQRHPAEAIRAAMLDPARDRTEPLYRFVERVKAGQAAPTPRESPEARQERICAARRARDELAGEARRRRAAWEALDEAARLEIREAVLARHPETAGRPGILGDLCLAEMDRRQPGGAPG